MAIHVVVNRRQDWWSELQQSFAAAGRRLGVQGLDPMVLGPQDEFPKPGDLVLFLHNTGQPHEIDEPGLEQFVQAGGRVLPVIEDGPVLKNDPLPGPIQAQNALLRSTFGADWADAVVDEVVSELWGGRRKKKVFLSYKRTDSEDMARQIHAALQHRRYTVFLDDCSIEHGVDFQRELKYWLNDADVLLLLASPNFAASRWLIEEIEFALAHNIGITVAEFPNLPKPKDQDVNTRDVLQRIPADRRHPLPSSTTLDDPALETLLGHLVRERGQSLQMRLTSLLDPARRRFSLETGHAADETSGVLGELRLPKRLSMRVLPYRPTVESLYGALDREFESVGVCYEENDPKHESFKALAWALSGRRNSPPHEAVLWTL